MALFPSLSSSLLLGEILTLIFISWVSDVPVAAMEEIRNVSCSEICTDGSCTYPIPADVRTGEHCDHTWKSENETVLDHGIKNLTLPDCRKVIHFVTRCDDTKFDHSVTYRGFNTTQDHNTVVDPLDPNTTVDPLGSYCLQSNKDQKKCIWLPILIVLILVGLFIGLFIMYRRKMFCFKRTKGPNPADGTRDLRDAEDGTNGASDPLINNRTPPGPNRDGVKTDHMNGGEDISIL